MGCTIRLSLGPLGESIDHFYNELTLPVNGISEVSFQQPDLMYVGVMLLCLLYSCSL